MPQRKIIKTTLGELVVSVTDEVMAIVRDRSAIYMVVSYILGGLMDHQGVRIHKWLQQKRPSHFVEELAQKEMRWRVR